MLLTVNEIVEHVFDLFDSTSYVFKHDSKPTDSLVYDDLVKENVSECLLGRERWNVHC